MKKIITLLLILTMLVMGSATVLAEDTSPIEEGEHGKPIEDLFDMYNPSAKQTYLNIKTEHHEFHEERSDLRIAQIQKYAGQFEIIFGQISSGVVTPEDGKAQLESLRTEINAMRNEVDTIHEQKQAEVEEIKADFEALRENMKTALKAEEIDEYQVASYLNDLNVLFQKHLDMDYKCAAMVDAVLVNY